MPWVTQAEIPVNLTLEPLKGGRGGATVSVAQSSEGNAITVTADYPQGEGGGGYVAFRVESFAGPLSHITFNAKGNMSMARLSIRGSDKNAEVPGVKMPELDETMRPHSIDFSALLHSMEANGTSLSYPIIEVIIGFRYGQKPQDFIEISDLVLHAAD